MSDTAHAITTKPATPEEQAAVQKFLTLIDGDEDLRAYKKYIQESVDRNIVLIGLRNLNLDSAAAFKTLKEMYRLVTKVYPDLASKVDPDKVKQILERKMLHFLDRKGKDDKTLPLLFFRVGDWKPSQFKPEEMLVAAALFSYGTVQKWPEIQDMDIVAVGDIAGFKLKHARLMTLGRARQAIRFYNATPQAVREKSVGNFKGAAISINSKGMFVRAYKVVKKAIPKDLRKFIHITKKDLTIIQKYVPKEKLPVELGGTIPDKDAWATDVESVILNDSKLWKDFKDIRADLLQKTKGIKPEIVDDDKPLPGEEENDDDDKELAGLEEDDGPEDENDSEDEKDTKM